MEGNRFNVVPWLLGANIVMFMLDLFNDLSFTNSLALVSSDIISRPWIIITSMFLHGGPGHLFFNMYALFLFGTLIEQKIGSRRFLILYFASGIAAGIGFSAFQELIIGETARAVGASGAIMGILGMTIMLLPDMKVLFFFVIPMSMRTAGIIFAALDILGVFGVGIQGIANVAHLAGLALGLGYGWLLLKVRKRFQVRFVDREQKTRTSNSAETNIDLSEEDVQDYLRNGRI